MREPDSDLSELDTVDLDNRSVLISSDDDWSEVTTIIEPERCAWTRFENDSPEQLAYLRERSKNHQQPLTRNEARRSR